MKIPPRYRSIIFLFISAIILSAATPVIAKLIELGEDHLIEGRNPISFCNVLFVGNTVAFVILLILYSGQLQLHLVPTFGWRDWIYIILGAVLSGFLAPTLFFLGIQFANVVNVVLITTLEIPFTLLVGRVLFREKMKLGVVIGSLIVVAGVFVTTLLQTTEAHIVENVPHGAFFRFLEKTPWSGEILIFLAIVVYGSFLFLSRYALQFLPLSLYNIFRVSIGGFIFFWIVLVFFGLQHFVDLFSPFLWRWMLLYGTVIVALDIYFKYMGLRHAEAAEIAISAAIIPVSSIVFAYFILGIIPTPAQWIGGSITIFGILIALIFKLRRKEEIILGEPEGFSGI